ncbi:hypothetical protein [Alicyclobacillus ferrooxydans]|uniref:Uncharacterized protein n=1 Tax=Alicyclobacillus ferrooxydans TaxID=471514 RepID=A0A0P9D0F6_9BACL|nr:hypothetical protein [Alicyclobacillus ferrooxydans]KPV42955.1 hypothetical protein AN477_14835 [Alicyclobacillus ferrooxydans]
MIIGFGFGSPLTALIMLLATSAISYVIWRSFRKLNGRPNKPTRAELRRYYEEQRERARALAREFDISDEEIERRIDRELDNHDGH